MDVQYTEIGTAVKYDRGGFVVRSDKRLNATGSAWRRLTATGASDPIDMLETQMMLLMRNFSLMGRQHESDLGMDRAGYLLLRTLELLGPASINTLADALGLDGSTVTRQVGTMADAGFVEREAHSKDRRVCIVRPTPWGLEQMAQVRERRRTTVVRLTSGWSAHERRTLSKMLARLNNSIAQMAVGAAGGIAKKSRRARARRLKPASGGAISG